MRVPAPLVRIGGFVRERVPAHHVVYGLAWSVAAESGAALVSGAGPVSDTGAGPTPARWRPGTDTAARAAALVATLVAMRMLDDVKDLEHDRVRSPDRPLAAGRVAVTEVLGAAAVCAGSALALARVALGPASTASLAVAQAYGLALWPLDRALLTARRDPSTEAALAYPVQALGTGFLLLSAAETGAAPSGRRRFLLVPLFAAAFLQFEIARKTRSTAAQDPSDYSSVLPWRACAAAIVGLGEAAVWGVVAASAPWRRRGRAAVVSWAPAALSVLPPLVVVDMVRGRRTTARTLPSVAVLLALYLFVPVVTLEVQRP